MYIDIKKRTCVTISTTKPSNNWCLVLAISGVKLCRIVRRALHFSILLKPAKYLTLLKEYKLMETKKTCAAVIKFVDIKLVE